MDLDGFMDDEEQLREQLVDYRRRHEALDNEIDRMVAGSAVNMFDLQKLKRERLWLKDMIEKMESALLPDIIA